MWKRISPLALALAAGTGIAWACSVDAPFQLLDDRADTLRAPVVNSFSYELARLAGNPADALHPNEQPWENPAEVRARIEGEAVARLRSGQDKGEGLSEAVRLYTQGALAFNNRDWNVAAILFERARTLPDGKSAEREVWATYMLGVLAGLHPGERSAAEWFERTRLAANNGAPDPLGLAVTSYGEQARPSFRAAKHYADSGNLTAYAEALDKAASLYLQQAARGSDSGKASVWIVAKHMLHDHDRAAAALERPALRHLAVAYVLAANPSYTMLGNPVDPDLPENAPPQPLLSVPAILRLLADTAGDGPQADFDRLAQAAYEQGDYALARDLAPRAEGPLAAWIRAKLALQDGDDAAAARFYAEALGQGGTLEPSARDRLSGENAIMALNAGEYARALTLLLAAGNTYWGDIAYIAERVMSTDEIKAFVDALPPVAMPDKTNPPVQVRLRDLLARRLTRDGRGDEALAYYLSPEQATAYQTALKETRTARSDIAKAEAWYTAAHLLRQHGLEIMGTEGEPDYTFWGGQFEFGAGQTDAESLPEAERTRFVASAAQPPKRFHYRYLAVQHAERAADLLPPRSQAFAATLCQTAQWMNASKEDAEVQRLYARYLKQGALVPFGKTFGQSCPDPDFTAASSTERRLLTLKIKAELRKYRWPLLAGAAITLIGGALLWRKRKTKKQA